MMRRIPWTVEGEMVFAMVGVRVAEVDGEAEDEDGDEQAGVGDEVFVDGALRGVSGEREHDDDGSGAGGDGKGERIENFLA